MDTEKEAVSRSPLTAKDRDLFKQAAEAFFAGRSVEVVCDVCETKIAFKSEGAIIRHDCECGKFKGVLKTL